MCHLVMVYCYVVNRSIDPVKEPIKLKHCDKINSKYDNKLYTDLGGYLVGRQWW